MNVYRFKIHTDTGPMDQFVEAVGIISGTPAEDVLVVSDHYLNAIKIYAHAANIDQEVAAERFAGSVRDAEKCLVKILDFAERLPAGSVLNMRVQDTGNKT